MTRKFSGNRNIAAFSMALATWMFAGSGTLSADEVADTIVASTAEAAAPLMQQNGIMVTLDQAKVIRIDHEADTVIIGNPSIADAVLYDRKTLVITGKSFGSTNLLILDDKGELVVDEFLRVEPASSSMVTVHRQTNSFTYSCTPTCRAAIAPGDNADFFENSIKQSQSRNAFASQEPVPTATTEE